MTGVEVIQRGQRLAEQMVADMVHHQNNRPRSLQSQKRILGMSEMGGCREYIRATIAGDKKMDPTLWKQEAEFGTALGDYIENAIGEAHGDDVMLQHRLTLELQVGGHPIRVSGSTDIIYITDDGDIVDLKSKNGLGLTKREGPTFKNKAQLAGYMEAAVQEGLVNPETVAGHLMFFDRGAAEKGFLPYSMDYAQAKLILEAVSERLEDVASALSTARMATRDEPESWCWAVQCPFYNNCWAGYMPDQKIENPEALEAIRIYVEARRDRNDDISAVEAAKQMLEGIEGVTPDGVVVRWTEVMPKSGNAYMKLEVREPKQ